MVMLPFVQGDLKIWQPFPMVFPQNQIQPLFLQLFVIYRVNEYRSAKQLRQLSRSSQHKVCSIQPVGSHQLIYKERCNAMETQNSALVKFFGVVARGQTYLNILYLLLSFPLGLFYFVFLITGLALGIPLIIVWVGLLILLAVFAVWYGLIAFERQLAIWLLHENIPPMSREDFTGMSLWQSFLAAVRSPVTWKGLVYLFAKFPLGLLSFITVTVLGSLSIALVAAPIYYSFVDPGINFMWDFTRWQPWVIDTLGEAFILSLIGIFVALISLHVFNALALVSGVFARVMLGSSTHAPETPTNPSQPVIVPTAAQAEGPTPPDVPAANTPEHPAAVG